MRGLGLAAGLTTLPSWLVVFAALVTQLGDAWFLVLSVGLVYWLGDDRLTSAPRAAGATLIAVGLVALSVTIGLKSLFALPRPPGAETVSIPVWLPPVVSETFESAATGDGFGFPSGHAIGATMVYGGAAALFDRLGQRRWLAAGSVILAVGISRPVLGVHYFVDVLAGIAVGALGLWVVLKIAREARAKDRERLRVAPTRGFAVAVGVAGGATGITALAGHYNETFRAGIALGTAIGGLGAWYVVGPVHERLGRLWTLTGAMAVGTVWLLAYLIGIGEVLRGPFAAPGVRFVTVLLFSTVAGGLLVGWPVLGSKTHHGFVDGLLN